MHDEEEVRENEAGQVAKNAAELETKVCKVEKRFLGCFFVGCY